MVKEYKFIIQIGAETEPEFLLEKDELYLGRDVNNDIIISDPEVSRRHARVMRHDNQYLFEDLGSTNGSFILGQRVTSPTVLKPGTVVSIGERVLIKYEEEETDPNATVAMPSQMISQMEPPPIPAVKEAVLPQSTKEPTRDPEVEHHFEEYSEQSEPAISAKKNNPIQNNSTPSVSEVNAPTAVQQKKMSRPVMILLIVLAVILVFCVIPWIIVEITNSYCSLLPGFFNAIQPGACP